MRITIEKEIDDATIERFLALYRASLEHLDDKAVARQSLTDDEFRDEMRLDSVLKFIGRDADGEPCALALVAADLEAVPWISPAYFAKRFPEQYERQAIFYFNALLVDPHRQRSLRAYALLRRTVDFVAQNHGIAAFDCCQFTEREVDLPQMIARVVERACRFNPLTLDTQHYYAYEWTGWHEGAEPEIDLVAIEAAEQVRRRVRANRR